MIGQQLVTILASDWFRARVGVSYSSLIGQAINQPAVICYTSGTTANPKGALLSQAQSLWHFTTMSDEVAKWGKQGIIISH